MTLFEHPDMPKSRYLKQAILLLTLAPFPVQASPGVFLTLQASPYFLCASAGAGGRGCPVHSSNDLLEQLRASISLERGLGEHSPSLWRGTRKGRQQH